MLPMGKLSSSKNANAKFLQLRATEWAVGSSDGAISGGSSAALISAGFGLSRQQQPECRPSPPRWQPSALARTRATPVSAGHLETALRLPSAFPMVPYRVVAMLP